jgi:hypothetical protein
VRATGEPRDPAGGSPLAAAEARRCRGSRAAGVSACRCSFPLRHAMHHELLRTSHIVPPDRGDPLRAPAKPHGVVAWCWFEDPTAAGGELPPQSQLDLELLLDEVVRQIVRHEVVVPGSKTRNQHGAVLTLDRDEVSPSTNLREGDLHAVERYGPVEPSSRAFRAREGRGRGRESSWRKTADRRQSCFSAPGSGTEGR